MSEASRALLDVIHAYREGFVAVPLHAFLDLRLRRLRDPTTVTAPIGESARGIAGVHGGAIAALADVCCAIAGTTAWPGDYREALVRTKRLDLEFYAQPVARLTARAHVCDRSLRSVRVRCDITDARDTLVAEAAFVGVLVDR